MSFLGFPEACGDPRLPGIGDRWRSDKLRSRWFNRPLSLLCSTGMQPLRNEQLGGLSNWELVVHGQKQKRDYLEKRSRFFRGSVFRRGGKWLQDFICCALTSCFFKLLPKVMGKPDAHFLVYFKIQINTNNVCLGLVFPFLFLFFPSVEKAFRRNVGISSLS